MKRKIERFSESYFASSRFAPLARRLLDHRFLLLAVLGGLILAGDYRAGIVMADDSIYGDFGLKILSGHWRVAFAESWLQIGPLQLLVNGAIKWLADGAGRSFGQLMAPAGYLGLVAASIGCFRYMLSTGDLPRSKGLELLLGAALLCGGGASIAVHSGHVAEGLIPILWVVAALEAKRDRTLVSGLLIGVAAGFKLWGGLGVPILLFTPSLRKAFSGGLVTGAFAALVYGPFALWGDFQSFAFAWKVRSNSIVAVFLPANSDFGWQLRLVQVVLVLVVAIPLAAWLRKGSFNAVWVLPLSLVALRLLFDPLDLEYYVAPIATLAALGACFIAANKAPLVRAPLAAGIYLLIWLPFVSAGPLLAVWEFLLSLILGRASVTGVPALRSSPTP